MTKCQIGEKIKKDAVEDQISGFISTDPKSERSENMTQFLSIDHQTDQLDNVQCSGHIIMIVPPWVKKERCGRDPTEWLQALTTLIDHLF